MKILIVDDSLPNALLAASLLETIDDVDVMVFEDAAEALNWSRENTVDLVVTDYRMPGMNGVEMLQAFRTMKPDDFVPLVVVTADMSRTVLHEALKAGATDFLRKPFDDIELHARATNMLALRRQYLDIKLADQMKAQLVSELSKAIAEKDLALTRMNMMAREIDHRVMNSLQIVSNLLSMQGHATNNPEISHQLEVASGRVFAVARVHKNFYSNDMEEFTECLPYLKRLCADFSEMLDLAEIIVEGDETKVPTAQLVLLGLITNELITNAAKHGAAPISVSFRETLDNELTLVVSDQGQGLPAGFQPERSRGLGMRVVVALTEQLHGRLDATIGQDGRGACFKITF